MGNTNLTKTNTNFSSKRSPELALISNIYNGFLPPSVPGKELRDQLNWRTKWLTPSFVTTHGENLAMKKNVFRLELAPLFLPCMTSKQKCNFNITKLLTFAIPF